jgi:tRNA(fMet)-specific endonuclease VapC
VGNSTSSTAFTGNRSQAVRLSKAVAFPENVHRVEILGLGEGRLVVSEGERWDDFFLTGPHVYVINTLKDQLCISSITLGELSYGTEKSDRRDASLSRFVARSEVLPFGEKAAVHYGQIGTELERAGTPCGLHDMQIGAHARSEGPVVVTNSMRKFSRMPGTRAENGL